MGLRFCISSKLPGGTDVAGPWTTIESQRFQTHPQARIYTPSTWAIDDCNTVSPNSYLSSEELTEASLTTPVSQQSGGRRWQS